MLDDPVRVTLAVAGATLGAVVLVAFLLAALYGVVSFSQWFVDRRVVGVEPGEPSRKHLDALGSTFVSEVISAGTFFSLHLIGAIDPPQPAPRDVRGRRPILLVPGFLQTRTTFVFLGPRLSGYGLGPIYTINLRTLEGGLEHQARALSEHIDRIRNATECAQIDVVAHSTGGLVARLAEAGRRTPRIRRLVTLGTPHAGTRVAHLGLGAMARDVRPSSEVLRRLPKPPPGQLVSISSSHDFVVLPPESARVTPLGRDVLVRHVGHLALLTDPEVADEVVKALGEDIEVRRAKDIFEPVETRDVEVAAHPRGTLEARPGGA